MTYVPLAMLLLAQTSMPPPAGQNVAPVPAPPAPLVEPEVSGIDRTFALAAMQGNAAEIALGHLAIRRSSVPEVVSFARKMVTEHTGLASDMMPALRRVYGGSASPPFGPPDTLAYEHLSTIAEADFDQGYLMTQVADHLATMAAFTAEADNGTQPALRALARKWLPTIASHLELAVDLASRVGGDSPFKSHE